MMQERPNIIFKSQRNSRLWATYMIVATLFRGCEHEIHTPKIGTRESSWTPEILELDFRGQTTSHWGVLCIIGKLLKCRCRKWPCMGHLDIFSISYGK